MSIVRMYSEIVADTDRNKEAWLFANDVEQLLLWHERLSQAFFDVTDWLNSVNAPVIVFPLSKKRNDGMVLRDTYRLSPSTIPKSPPVFLVDSIIMENYLPKTLPFENVEFFAKFNAFKMMDSWKQNAGRGTYWSLFVCRNGRE